MKYKIGVDELLLEVLFQSCGEHTTFRGEDIDIIDNMCISAYEDACGYLVKQGLLERINLRVYKLKVV